MLPFLGRKDVASGIIAKRMGKPSVEVADEVHAPGEGEESAGIEDCMKDILSAIEHKSPMDMAKAFKRAMSELNSGEENV